MVSGCVRYEAPKRGEPTAMADGILVTSSSDMAERLSREGMRSNERKKEADDETGN
jgi:hypothetical protein